MSNGGGPLPVGDELDAVFGAGKPAPDRRVMDYLLWAYIAPRSAAHYFAQDARLFGKVWILVVAATVAFVVTEFVTSSLAVSWGLTSALDDTSSLIIYGIFILLYLTGYPLLKWIWSYVLRQGNGLSDRGLSAALALSFGVNILLLPLQSVLGLLFNGIPTGPLLAEDWTNYDQLTMILAIIGLFASLLLTSFYFSDVLEMGYRKALFLNFLSSIIWTLIVLAVILALMIPVMDFSDEISATFLSRGPHSYV